MSTMLYKHPAESRNRVKVGKDEFDYVVVDEEAVEEHLDSGWCDNPANAIGNPADTNGNGTTSKDELLAYAAEKGVEVKKSWSKEKIQEAIDNAVEKGLQQEDDQ